MRTSPPIWRRLLVSSDITLAGLHDLLQLAMGWTDSHMHEFRFRGQCYAMARPIRIEVWRRASTSAKYGLNQLLVRLEQRSFTRMTATIGSMA